MRFRNTFQMALMVGCLGTGLAFTAQAADEPQILDLSGQWRLDPSHSDSPRRPGGGLPGSGRIGRGGWGPGEGMEGRGGMRRGGGGAGANDRGGLPEGRPRGLPEVLRIEQDSAFVRLADTTGTLLEEIALNSATVADTSAAARKALKYSGHWKQGHLEVRHASWMGRMITDTFELADDGKTLVVMTRMDADDRAPARQFKRVYQRVPL